MGSIKEWPCDERPREKLLTHGPGALSDAELLAIFLRTGVPGCSAVDLARRLLREFGCLRGLLGAPREQFCAAHGMGDAKYTQLQAALEMGKRQLRAQLDRGDALSSPERTRAYLQAELAHLPLETFGCLWLDTRHRVIRWEALSTGTLDAAAIYPREVVKRALAVNAAAVILAHNHPSGDTRASRADRDITEQLREALGVVSVRLLDHLIIGDGTSLSFVERGWL